MCYIANVGDSRIIRSSDNGKTVQQLTVDHRPSNEIEMKRIISNGGKIYQVKTDLPIEVPYRVLPGRLSVSRTIGDIEAKLPQFEGNPKVVVGEPDIFEVKLNDNDDFLMLGCDGIFDELSNEEIVQFIWRTKNNLKNIHEQAADAVDAVIKLAAYKESYDNLTTVLIALKGFSSTDFGKLSDDEVIVNYVKPARLFSNERLKKHPSFDGTKKTIGERKISIPSLKKLFISHMPNNPFRFPKITLPKKVTLLSVPKDQ
jgi:serine/threonine protein phosphatase PrpC